MNKTKIYFTLVIFFWFAVLAAAPLYLEPLMNSISPDVSGVPAIRYSASPKISPGIGLEGSTCRFSVPSQKSIIIRMDDVQAWAWNSIAINLSETVLERGIPITLGVIPENIDRDPLIMDYLLSKAGDPKVEIAQHGTNHDKFEFRALSGKDAFNRTGEGLNKLVQTFGEYPVTFIPPNNEYSDSTPNALSRLGFHVISAREGEYKFDGKIVYAGYSTMTKSSEKAELNPVNGVIESCRKALQLSNLCVINMHPQDYADSDKKTVNAERYLQFVKLLDGLKGTGARFMAFRDLVEC